MVMVRAGGEIAKVNALEVREPGFTTVILTSPVVAISAAEMAAVSCVLLTNVVVRFAPVHLTVEFETKFVPFTVNVNAGPPDAVEFGSRLVSDGTGALTEI